MRAALILLGAVLLLQGCARDEEGCRRLASIWGSGGMASFEATPDGFDYARTRHLPFSGTAQYRQFASRADFVEEGLHIGMVTAVADTTGYPNRRIDSTFAYDSNGTHVSYEVTDDDSGESNVFVGVWDVHDDFGRPTRGTRDRTHFARETQTSECLGQEVAMSYDDAAGVITRSVTGGVGEECFSSDRNTYIADANPALGITVLRLGDAPPNIEETKLVCP